MKLYVAVVDRQQHVVRQRHGVVRPLHEVFEDHLSNRPEGDWAAFVHENRDVAVNRALRAVKAWGATEYRVLVGELTGMAVEPVSYAIVPLIGTAPIDAGEVKD